MIDVLAASVDEVHELADALAAPGAALLVDDRDRAAASDRVRPEDARRTLAGRAALRLLVATRLGGLLRDAARIVVDRTCDRCGAAHGQPRIDGLSVSTSTSGPHVLVAVADAEARVGIDVQIVPDALWDGFDAYVLHPDERGTLPHGEEGVSERIRIWTEKEAVLKAAGLGLRAAPARLRISAVEMPGGRQWGAGALDPGAWRPVAATDVRAASGTWVTTLAVGDGTWAVLAAATPQPIRRWSVADLGETWPADG